MCDAIRIVTNGSAIHDLDADFRKCAREIGGVGIDGEAEQQLVTDGEDLYLHGGRRAGGTSVKCERLYTNHTNRYESNPSELNGVSHGVDLFLRESRVRACLR